MPQEDGAPRLNGEIDRWRAVLPSHVRVSLSRFYSEQELDQLSASLARPPRASCVRANTRTVSPEALANQVATELTKMDGSKWIVDGDANEISGSVVVHPVVPDAIMITPPVRPPLVIREIHSSRELLVSRRCAESVLRGANVFIPGVVGCSPHASRGDSVVVICDVHDRFLRGAATHILHTRKLDPKRMKGAAGKELTRAAPGEARGEQEALREATPGSSLPEGIVVLGRGTLLHDRRDVFGNGSGVACCLTECVYSSPSLNNLLPGSLYIQNLPSVLVSHALAPRPDDRCLDMCAAPGGKATHVATLLAGGSGSVLALDRTHAKVEVIRRWASDLGLSNLIARKADATLLLPHSPNPVLGELLPAAGHGGAARVAHQDKGESANASKRTSPLQLEEETFDRIILDPPCTALGLRPRLAIDIPPADMLRTAHYQRRMLHVAAGLLKVGGRMTYSTCTINPDENEGNVAYALKNLPLRLIPATPVLGAPGRHGACLAPEHCLLVQRFEPGGALDTNGFFLAVFEKTAGD